MDIDCSTCEISKEDCKMLNDYEFCQKHGYALWSPRDHSICKGCQFYDLKNDRCIRHAEYCIKNTEAEEQE